MLAPLPHEALGGDGEDVRVQRPHDPHALRGRSGLKRIATNRLDLRTGMSPLQLCEGTVRITAQDQEGYLHAAIYEAALEGSDFTG